jgi:hypothetical protein
MVKQCKHVYNTEKWIRYYVGEDQYLVKTAKHMWQSRFDDADCCVLRL